MLFAEEAAQASSFSGFDPFVIIFTILIAIGLVRLFAAKRKTFSRSHLRWLAWLYSFSWISS